MNKRTRQRDTVIPPLKVMFFIILVVFPFFQILSSPHVPMHASLDAAFVFPNLSFSTFQAIQLTFSCVGVVSSIYSSSFLHFFISRFR
ncbi:hypothetical protein QBC45DRAFT_32625 [Copromyces sp. CBS 386.78]|nr:hypothetical protein QBC45DRAFT_32625 [Copromyces sp. CBS 386.78]